MAGLGFRNGTLLQDDILLGNRRIVDWLPTNRRTFCLLRRLAMSVRTSIQILPRLASVTWGGPRYFTAARKFQYIVYILFQRENVLRLVVE